MTDITRGINLQLFADSTPEGEETDPITDPVEEVEETTEPTLLDLLETNPNIKQEFQSEVDRMISKAISTRDKKHQEELKKQEQRSKMTAEELQAEKARELSDREAKIAAYELKLHKMDYFKEHNLDLDLIDYIHVTDKEEVPTAVEKLQATINKVVEKEVQTRLQEQGYTPNTPEEQGDPITIDDLSGLSIEEINANWDKL